MKKTMNSDNVDPITESKKEKRKKIWTKIGIGAAV